MDYFTFEFSRWTILPSNFSCGIFYFLIFFLQYIDVHCIQLYILYKGARICISILHLPNGLWQQFHYFQPKWSCYYFSDTVILFPSSLCPVCSIYPFFLSHFLFLPPSLSPSPSPLPKFSSFLLPFELKVHCLIRILYLSHTSSFPFSFLPLH